MAGPNGVTPGTQTICTSVKDQTGKNEPICLNITTLADGSMEVEIPKGTSLSTLDEILMGEDYYRKEKTVEERKNPETGEVKRYAKVILQKNVASTNFGEEDAAIVNVVLLPSTAEPEKAGPSPKPAPSTTTEPGTVKRQWTSDELTGLAMGTIEEDKDGNPVPVKVDITQ
ncbi:MAG: hypothetical protein NT099_03405 [Candidatus Saganbacteria bacterium]|nr:hypothetical protein [Candidatus Saganbacteria bacterium]